MEKYLPVSIERVDGLIKVNYYGDDEDVPLFFLTENQYTMVADADALNVLDGNPLIDGVMYTNGSLRDRFGMMFANDHEAREVDVLMYSPERTTIGASSKAMYLAFGGSDAGETLELSGVWRIGSGQIDLDNLFEIIATVDSIGTAWAQETSVGDMCNAFSTDAFPAQFFVMKYFNGTPIYTASVFADYITITGDATAMMITGDYREYVAGMQIIDGMQVSIIEEANVIVLNPGAYFDALYELQNSDDDVVVADYADDDDDDNDDDDAICIDDDDDDDYDDDDDDYYF